MTARLVRTSDPINHGESFSADLGVVTSNKRFLSKHCVYKAQNEWFSFPSESGSITKVQQTGTIPSYSAIKNIHTCKFSIILLCVNSSKVKSIYPVTHARHLFQ